VHQDLTTNMEAERQNNQRRNSGNQQHKPNKKPGKNTAYKTKQHNQPHRETRNEQPQTQSGNDDIYESTEERGETTQENRKTAISLPSRDEYRSLNTSQSSVATDLSSRSELRGSKGTNIDDEDLCLMCLEPIHFWALGKCNHKETCALCAIRRRVLYGHLECPVCRETLETVVLTNEEKSYEDFAPVLKDMGFDPKSKSYYQGPAAAHFAELSQLWELHCPIGCEFKGKNLALLKKHVAEQHNVKYCNVCLQDRKVFLQEQKLYTTKQLKAHLEVGTEEPKIKHELCQFCDKYFFDMDRLYDHMHKNHETCFICQKHPSSMHQYYANYATLEHHFRSEHHLCEEPECLAKKFIVFEDAEQLKIHQAKEHKGVARKGRGHVVVDLDFNKRRAEPNTPTEEAPAKPPIEEIVSSEESFPTLSGGPAPASSASIAPPSWSRPRATDFQSMQDFPTLPATSKPLPSAAPKKTQPTNNNNVKSKVQEEYPALSTTTKKPPTTTTAYKPPTASSTSQPAKISYKNQDSDDEDAYPALGSGSSGSYNPTWGQPTVEVINAAQFTQQQESNTSSSWAKSSNPPNLEQDFPTLPGHPKGNTAPRTWGPSSSSNISTHDGRLIIQTKKKGKKK